MIYNKDTCYHAGSVIDETEKKYLNTGDFVIISYSYEGKLGGYVFAHKSKKNEAEALANRIQKEMDTTEMKELK